MNQVDQSAKVPMLKLRRMKIEATEEGDAAIDEKNPVGKVD